MMHNPDETLLRGLELQIVSVDDEIERVKAHLIYLRSERGRLAQRIYELRRVVGETR